MIDRLKLIMSYYSLSPSALADSIGVPRSSISHLLTGRNKPSLDFVLKLIKTYPEINLYWLLNGKGSFPSQPIVASPKDDALPFPVENNEPKRIEEKTAQSITVKEIDQSKKRQIRRIVFFFDDGSFETYSPN